MATEVIISLILDDLDYDDGEDMEKEAQEYIFNNGIADLIDDGDYEIIDVWPVEDDEEEF